MTQTVSERELVNSSLNNAIQSLKIVQTKESKYQLLITLTWKKGEHILKTQRNKTREWTSLDRLVRHINKNYGSIPLILIQLWDTKNDTKNDT